jgi:3D (Asp-Asp-Asp) domain-containing protein
MRLRAADSMVPAAGSALAGSTGVRYRPARALTVEADGATVSSWAAGESVGEALANAGVALVGSDYARPGVELPLPVAGAVQVVRVIESAEIEQEVLTFETRWAPAPDIEIDHQQLVDTGEPGVVAQRTRVRYEDGQETERLPESEWVAIEPRDRVMGYGTKIVIRTLDTPGGPIEYWRAVPMYATSYSPCRLGVPNYCSTTMANGEPLKHGNAAFIVRWYRAMRGQYVYVPGYGTAKISDTGGGIPGRNWIDLGYSDEDYVSWHNWTTVYFLTPVPPESLIMWVLE